MSYSLSTWLLSPGRVGGRDSSWPRLASSWEGNWKSLWTLAVRRFPGSLVLSLLVLAALTTLVSRAESL